MNSAFNEISPRTIMGQPDMLGHLSHVQNISKPCRPLILSENGLPIWILMTLKKLASTIPEKNHQPTGFFLAATAQLGASPQMWSYLQIIIHDDPWNLGNWNRDLEIPHVILTPGKFGGDFAAHSMTPSPTPSPMKSLAKQWTTVVFPQPGGPVSSRWGKVPGYGEMGNGPVMGKNEASTSD